MNWTLVIQAIGVTIGAIVAIHQYSSRLPMRRLKEELKLDLEIRDRIPTESDDFALVSARIKELVTILYNEPSKPKFNIYNWDDLTIGASLSALSSYFTLLFIQDHSYWGLATAFMIVVGFGMIPDAFKPADPSDK